MACSTCNSNYLKPLNYIYKEPIPSASNNCKYTLAELEIKLLELDPLGYSEKLSIVKSAINTYTVSCNRFNSLLDEKVFNL